LQERISEELELIRWKFPDVDYQEDGQWVCIPSFPLSSGWNRPSTEVAFQIPVGYPGTPPYGIYVPVGLQFNGVKPNNYTEPAGNHPPFPGSWGVFSWKPLDGQWRPTVDLRKGSNLLNWVMGFADRFAEGL
jgi:hypothetical protein